MAKYSQTRSFNLGIAEDVSVEAALIYNDLVYAQESFGNGKWFYRSYEQLRNRLPYSEKTLRRHVAKLAEGGWITTKVMKVNGVPVCHYQISRFLSDKMTVSKEKDKLTVSINNNTKEIQSTDFSFGEINDSDPAPDHDGRTGAPALPLLQQIIDIVNPKEKPTADRLRALNARLKDYTGNEIIQSANALSKSEWHRENKQMSIDNLLAPSKFGRWYAQRTTESTAPQVELTQAQIDEKLAKERKELDEKNKNRDWGFGDAPK